MVIIQDQWLVFCFYIQLHKTVGSATQRPEKTVVVAGRKDYVIDPSDLLILENIAVAFQIDVCQVSIRYTPRCRMNPEQCFSICYFYPAVLPFAVLQNRKSGSMKSLIK